MEIKKLIGVLVLCGAAITVASTQAAKVPPAIAAAFKNAYPNAVIKAASSEKENGKIVWEIESVDGKTHRDIIYAPDGTPQVIEEQITVADVPPVVLSAVWRSRRSLRFTSSPRPTAVSRDKRRRLRKEQPNRQPLGST